MNTLEIAQSVNEDDLKLMRELHDMYWRDKKDHDSFLKVQEICAKLKLRDTSEATTLFAIAYLRQNKELLK